MPDYKLGDKCQNEACKKVEAHVAKSPGLSQFCREEPVDGYSDESYSLRTTQLSIYSYAPYYDKFAHAKLAGNRIYSFTQELNRMNEIAAQIV